MTTDDVMKVLAQVTDPEIPVLPITDLGIVEEVRVEGDRVEVDLLPTFAGCPALGIIRKSVEGALTEAGAAAVKVTFRTSPAWTTERVSEAGREALKGFGIAPPTAGGVSCPYCGSGDTHRESSFGPTLCRSVYYCEHCHNPFELMKPVVLQPRAL